jgi:hypothetical protein
MHSCKQRTENTININQSINVTFVAMKINIGVVLVFLLSILRGCSACRCW